MNDFETNVITIINTALGNDLKLQNNTPDLKQLYDFSCKQQIVSLIYYGLEKSLNTEENELKDLFFKNAVYLMQYSERQLYEAKRVFEKFEQNKISYVPLKGLVLKEMYPSTDMRQMGDIDILIDDEQYGMVRDIMTDFGYSLQNETEYEYIWKKKNIVFEFHKYLFSPKNSDLYTYAKNIRYEKKGSKSCRAMCCEDMYIYLFLHFVKHFKNRGAGIRFIVDLFVFKKQYPNMNMKYIKEVLCRLEIYEFYINIEKMIEVWFSNGEENDVVDFITSKLFNDTVYGDLEKAEVAAYIAEKEKSLFPKIKMIRKFIFPDLKVMSSKYCILRKIPLLLPFFWVYHWFFVILFRRNSIKKRINSVAEMSKSSADKVFDEWRYVGLKK